MALARKDISTLWDRDMRIAIDENFKELYSEYTQAGLDAKDARNKAIQAVADALTAKEVANVTREEMLAIIREQTQNGDLAPEIAQARGSEPTLGGRLNSIDSNLAQTGHQVNDIAINVKYPPIPLVGAVADGVTDDAQALYNIHTYANDNNYSVNYGNYSYFIGSCLNIPIKTSTEFGASTIIIDETKALNGFQGHGYFNVQSTEETRDITAEVGAQLVLEWKKGANQLPSLANYVNHYVIVEDSNDIIVERSTSGQRYLRKDQTVLANNGKVLSDLCFNFNGFTSVKVKYREDAYIELTGGVFLFNGQRSLEIESAYRCPIFFIERSKTKLKNMVNDLLTGKDDLSGQATMGLFRTKNVDDFELENVKLLPREHSGMGTYGFMITETINCTFNNVEGDKENTWGVMQSEYLKDFYVNNSKLNRIDAHIWGYNFTIENTDLGEYGFRLFGGGRLHINNVTGRNQSSFISLRSDYGTTWDGDLKIRDLKIKDPTQPTTRLILSNILDYDFNRDTQVFKSVDIDGVEFEFADSTNDSTIILYDHYGIPNENLDLYLADVISIRNVKVRGREKGVIALSIANSGYVKTTNAGSAGNVETFNPNAYINLENIDTVANENSIICTDAPANPNGTSFFPKINANNVDVRVNLYNSVVFFKGENIVLRRLTENGADPKSILELKDSKIKGLLLGTEGTVFTSALLSKLGHFKLESCIFGFPTKDGIKDSSLSGMHAYGVFSSTNRFLGWIKDCKLEQEVISSGVFVGKGQNEGMSHNAYVQSFEDASYNRRNSSTIMPLNDAPPLDGNFHTRGSIIWNEFGTPLGWKVNSSGGASSGNFTEILL